MWCGLTADRCLVPGLKQTSRLASHNLEQTSSSQTREAASPSRSQHMPKIITNRYVLQYTHARIDALIPCFVSPYLTVCPSVHHTLSVSSVCLIPSSNYRWHALEVRVNPCEIVCLYGVSASLSSCLRANACVFICTCVFLSISLSQSYPPA